MSRDERALLRLLQKELEPGEMMRWHGRPGRSWRAWREGGFVVSFLLGLILFATGIFGAWKTVECAAMAGEKWAEGIAACVFHSLIAGALISLGARICAQCLFRGARRRRTLCAVTDRRALLFSRLGSTASLTVWQGMFALPTEATGGLHGDHDVIFGYRVSRWSSIWKGSKVVPCGFLGIADREGALEALRQIDPSPARAEPAGHGPIQLTGRDRERVEAQLSPREVLRMAVRPNPSLDHILAFFLYCLGSGGAGILGVWSLAFLHKNEPMPLVLPCVLGIVALALMSAPWLVRRSMRRGFYAVTNRKIIKSLPGTERWGAGIWEPNSMGSYRVDIRADGSGDVHLSYASPGERDAEETFWGVPYVRSFCCLASRLVRGHAAPLPRSQA